MPPLIVPTLRVGAPSSGCGVALNLKRSSLCDRVRCLVDRIDPKVWHRTVSCDSLGLRSEPKSSAVTDDRVIRGGLGDNHRTGIAQDLASREMRAALTTGLFASDRNKQQVGLTAFHFREAEGCPSVGRDTGLHISRPASVEFALRNLARERISAPGLSAKWHGIDMAGETDRGLRARAAEPAMDERKPIREPSNREANRFFCAWRRPPWNSENPRAARTRRRGGGSRLLEARVDGQDALSGYVISHRVFG